jgi:hypothetical protein
MTLDIYGHLFPGGGDQAELANLALAARFAARGQRGAPARRRGGQRTVIEPALVRIVSNRKLFPICQTSDA